MDGSSTLHCNDGVWNGSLPSCKKSCNDPGYIGQGKRIGTDFSHGKVVTYECTSQNYSLLGKSRLTCHDGKSDSDAPRCKKSCAPLPPLSNGKIHNNNISHEDLISFSCNSGFQIQGPQQIKCLDGKWNDSSPSCIGVRNKPGILMNGRVIGRNYSYGSVIKFECDRGYELRGSPITTCRKGAWEGQFPECEICIQVGAIFWGFWAVNKGARNYWRAMITRINSTHVGFALLVDMGKTRSYLRTDQVLIIDKVPSIGDVLPNSPVIANQFNDHNLWWYRTGHATHTSTTSVLIKFDNGEEKWVPLERVRLVSRPRFCFDVK
ncbi:Sushi, von Willebrand factor type A, EGF and pentraxin domain-containing protein 1 [Stylophora pistillata]|uniref:Sushi, von Willebrand factor type A, EGF and pentraxin domain-containing protein 1 n=1 Tax=Stylophora pistillata TaxID=50429 RepID=A0A2B4SX28_STYPI|nr:Sushi, von Willebrand factor type A, EGF and pentraxin domain-containing protein 1 [Stylophora pistillata]